MRCCGRFGRWALAGAVLAAGLGAVTAGAAGFEARFDRGAAGGAKHGNVKFVGTPDGHVGITSEADWREGEEAHIRYGADAIAGFLDGDGTIEFWLYRKRPVRPGDLDDAVMQFLNADGRRYLDIDIGWEGAGGAEMSFNDDPGTEPAYDRNVYGDSVTLGAVVPVGGWMHVGLTFGPEEADNAVYVNGRQVALDRRGYADAKGQWVRRPGRMDFSRVREVFVGGVSSGRPGDATSVGGSARQSLVADVVLHDGIVTQFDLARIGGGAGAAVVSEVEHDAVRKAGFSGRLVAGNRIGVTVRGTPGVAGSFDVVHYPDLDREIALDWRGWGVYLEEKAFFDEGEVDLRDVEGYRVYASTKPFDPLAPGFDPVEQLDVEEQSFLLEHLEIDTPYYAAVVAEMRDGSLRAVIAPIVRQPLAETEPGVYTGTWKVGYGDRYPRAAIVGRLGRGQRAATLVDTRTFAADPALTIAVVTEPAVLKADEKSSARVSVTVTDANGDAVSGHRIKFLLATTSQYTGVVGGGAFAEQVGGNLRESGWGKTDLFGKLTATYVAGFAAKTAVIVARDMESNDTGAGSVRTFITASADIELEPVQTVLAAEGYELLVSSSDQWLTADGRSQARITARLTLRGQPVEGHRITFAVSPGMGSIRAVQDTTNRSGEARAVYTAGKKIGLALITATDPALGISGSVPIELRSDAPAKIAVRIDPEKLPADGRSRADVSVLVTDINDNPNDNTEVEYHLADANGDLRHDMTVTDRRGETTNEYTAGRTPGRVTIELTVRSMVPTEEELLKARALAVAVTDHDFF